MVEHFQHAETRTQEPSTVDAHEPSERLWALLGWARRHLFSSFGQMFLTLLSLWLIWKTIPPFLDWALFSAMFSGTGAECRAPEVGACWAFVGHKWRFIMFGLYPYDEQWRPGIAMVLFIVLLIVSANPRFWKKWLAWAWGICLVLVGWLMWGGFLGLDYVPNDRWGGLPLTLILSVVGIVLSFPFAILVALGRRSSLPAVRSWCVVYIEFWRGVPLVSVLFMASVMFPLFLPEGLTIDKLLRAQLGIILFTSAYVAEAIRGGLQALPRGQYEAADALGLSYWAKTRMVILPQAMRMVIPPLVNQFISTFKDTSLVIIIGLYDLLNSTKTALADPEWRAFYIEGYLLAAFIYFIFTFFMSRYSQFLERRLNAGTRRG